MNTGFSHILPFPLWTVTNANASIDILNDTNVSHDKGKHTHTHDHYVKISLTNPTPKYHYLWTNGHVLMLHARIIPYRKHIFICNSFIIICSTD